MTENALKKQIESGELSRVYLLYGEEKYMLKRSAKRIMQIFAENFPEFNLNEFTNDSQLESITDSAVALPLMAEQKCTVVSDINLDDKSADEVKHFMELVENVPESTVLLLYFPTLEFDAKKAKWKNLIKAVEKHGACVDFKARKSAELATLLERSAEKAGCSLSRKNAATIVEYVGTDMKALFNEVGKLCAFANGGEITAEMIERLVPKSLETTVFILSNALASGDYEKAYFCMNLLFSSGEEPVMILAVLSSAYVDMFRVKTAVMNKLPYSTPKSYGEYRGKEFRLSQAERSARKLSLEQIGESLGVLLGADMSLKGSRLSARLVLDGLIAKLLMISKGVRIA